MRVHVIMDVGSGVGKSFWIDPVPAQQPPTVAMVYEQARAEFSETELVRLTLAVISINGWNRLNIAFHTPAVNYVSNVKRSIA
jgi:hypothetical protein